VYESISLPFFTYKVEVNRPTNGARLPYNRPNNLIAIVPDNQNLDHWNQTSPNESFVIHPAVKKARPA
jgi:hypothetical protein